MFHGSVKSTGYPLHPLVSHTLPLPCVTVCHHISTGVYTWKRKRIKVGKNNDKWTHNVTVVTEYRIFMYYTIMSVIKRLSLTGNWWTHCDKGHIFLWAQQFPVGQGLFILEVSRSHTTKHHCWYDSSGWVISPSQRLPDNTHKRHTSMPLGGIRTHNFRRRAAADSALDRADTVTGDNGYWTLIFVSTAGTLRNIPGCW